MTISVEDLRDLRSGFHDARPQGSLSLPARCYVEPSLSGAEPGTRFQFERRGYFCVDPDSNAPDSGGAALVFNRTEPLRDSWSKIQKQQRKKR